MGKLLVILNMGMSRLVRDIATISLVSVLSPPISFIKPEK